MQAGGTGSEDTGIAQGAAQAPCVIALQLYLDGTSVTQGWNRKMKPLSLAVVNQGGAAVRQSCTKRIIYQVPECPTTKATASAAPAASRAMYHDILRQVGIVLARSASGSCSATRAAPCGALLCAVALACAF